MQRDGLGMRHDSKFRMRESFVFGFTLPTVDSLLIEFDRLRVRRPGVKRYLASCKSPATFGKPRGFKVS